MSNKSVRQNLTPSPLAGEGRDGGKSHKRPPPHSSPSRGEEARRNTGEGWDGGRGIYRARGLRSCPTEAELTLWRHLRLRQIAGYKFRRQQPLGSYVVDFICLEARLVIEIDGGQHATSTNDAKRTAWLESNGFLVMRFWNHEVMAAPVAVVTVIEHALRYPPHLYPPPRGGRKQGDVIPPLKGRNRNSVVRDRRHA